MTAIDFWNKSYKDGSYRELWHYDLPSAELVTLLAAQTVQPCESLDLGCGAGTEATYLARQGFRARGIDLAPAAGAAAREQANAAGATAEFVCGSVLALPFANGSFAFLSDRGCLHMIPESDREQYALEAARVLRGGGIFLLRGARPGAGENFIPITPARVHELFDKTFEIGPVLESRGVANVGTLDHYVAVMRRRD